MEVGKVILSVACGLAIPLYLVIADGVFKNTSDVLPSRADSVSNKESPAGVVPVVSNEFYSVSKADDQQVAIRLAGCPSLQDALGGDSKRSSKRVDDGVVTINRKGRTIKDICDTVGYGCSVCEEVNK